MPFSPLVIKNNAEAILIQDNLSNLVCNSENYTLPTSIASGNFYVTIDSEIVDVTGISTDVTGNYILYVDRAKEDTISVSHDAGTKVKLNILSKHITDITDTITDILNGDTTVGGLSSTGTISTISLNTSNLTVGSLSGILKAAAGVVSGSATTANLPENTNLYYTNARARASISETITGIDYDSTTGVFSLTSGYAIPTSTKLSNYDTAYTLRVTTWGNGLSFSSNTAYVNYDTTNLKIVSGKLNTIQNIDASSSPTFAGLTLTDFSGVLKADSGSLSSNTDTDDLPEGTTNKYFSNALARLSISETITGIDYNSTSGVLSLTSGYIIPTTTEQSNWDSAYTKRIDNWLTGLIYDSTNSTVIIDSDFIVLQAKASIYSGSVGLSYDFSSGAITVQSGYTIPSDSQISQWNVAYSNRVENWGYGLSVDYSTNTVSINYDASNLTISAFKLTTIQDIGVTSTPQFAGIFLNDLTGILKSTGAGVVDNPTTDDLTEGSTNKYFSSTLARNSISETITGIDYDSTTGVFSLTTGYVIPTTTNATNWTTAYSLRVVTWGNGINFSDNTAYIDYNTTNLKITSNQIDTIQSIATTASPTFAGLTLTGLSGVLKASTGSISGSATTDDLTEGSTNKYFSNSLSRAAISEDITGIDYDSTTGVFSITSGYVIPTTVQTTAWDALVSGAEASARNSISETITGIDYDSTTGVFSLTSGYVIPTTTEETNWNSAYSLRVVTWGNGINLTDNTANIDYNTTNLQITANQINTIQNIAITSSPTFAGLTLTGLSGVLKASTGSISGSATTDDLTEGTTNKYFSNTLARNAISETITGITYTSSTGVFSLTSGYIIPATSDTTNWNTAYSLRVVDWGNGLVFADNTAHIDYNTTNLKITSNQINTIQNIAATSSPTFAGITLTGLSGILKATAGVISGSATTDNLTEGSTNKYFSNTLARASISETITGIDYDSTTGVFSLTTGYAIPTTTQISNWDALVGGAEAAARNSISETITGIDYDVTTGVFSLTAGYVIPTTTEETNWNTAYSLRVVTWGNGINLTDNTANIDYNTTNLKITSNQINTIQNIATSSSPTFAGLTLTGLSGVLKASTGVLSGSASTDDLSEGTTNKYFSNTLARNSISNTTTGLTYTSGTGVFSLTSGYVIPTTTEETNWNTAYSLRVVTWGNGINLTDNTANIDYNTTNLKITSNQINTIQNISTTSSPTFAGLILTDFSGMLKASAGSISGGANTDDLSEGSTNKYFSNTLARTAISNTITGITYASSTGIFSLTAGYVIPTTTEETNWNSAYSERGSQIAGTGLTWDGTALNVDSTNGLVDTWRPITSTPVESDSTTSISSGWAYSHYTLNAAHGATGAVVGTTNSQTLTNKTITSATIDGTSLVSGVFEGKISISDASNLIKIGTYAGKYTGASTNSIFIGGGAGPQTYSASINVSHMIGIGQNCLAAADASSSMVTAVGTYAAQTATESISSCYFGYGAANGSTSSKYNIAVGPYALCPTTAFNSIVLGYTANRYGNSIGRNIVIGYNAQLNQYNQSKDIYDNVIVGYLASQRNSGSKNVIIGSYAGQYAYASDSTNALATDNNIFIGYTAGRYETGSNKLIIGSTATYPIIYGDMSTGSLIFNKTLSLGYSGLYNGTLNILGDSTEGGKLRIYNSSASGSIVNNWRFDATGNLALIANYGATDNTVFYASPTYDVYFSHGIVVNTSSGTRPSYFSGDTQSYLLYVHTTNDMVGIGTNAPTELFTVNGNSAFNSVGKAGFASSTSYVDVTFDNEFNSVPIVVCTPEWSTSFYITAVSVTGFRINVGTPHGVTGTKYVHWHAFGEI